MDRKQTNLKAVDQRSLDFRSGQNSRNPNTRRSRDSGAAESTDETRSWSFELVNQPAPSTFATASDLERIGNPSCVFAPRPLTTPTGRALSLPDQTNTFWDGVTLRP